MINLYIDLIKKAELFKDMNEVDIVYVLKCLNPSIHKYKKDEHIINLGDKISKIGLVVEGEVIVLKESIEGNSAIISIIKSGDIFGGTFIFSAVDLWPVTVKSQKNCTILFFEGFNVIPRCEKSCSCHTKMLENFIKILSNKTLVLNKRIEYLSIKSVRSKIATYILEQYNYKKNNNIDLALNRNELADFLNISRPSLSREICRMRDEGTIDFHLSTFKIKNMEALKRDILF